MARQSSLSLPAAVRAPFSGGGGRFLFLPLPRIHHLAVFDSRDPSRITYMAFPGQPLFAAGRDALLAVFRSENIVRRYRLPDMRLEREAVLQDAASFTVAEMGSSSTGPLVLLRREGALRLVDTDRLTPIEPGPPPGMEVFSVDLSPDGGLAALHGRSASHRLARLSQGAFELLPEYSNSVSYLLPGSGGDAHFSSNGVLGPAFTPLEAAGTMTIPAVTGRSYVLLNWAGTAERGLRKATMAIRTVGSSGASLELGVVEGAESAESWSFLGAVPMHRRVWLFPEAKLLVTIGPGLDRLHLRPLDLPAGPAAPAPKLQRPLKVTSIPDPTFFPGLTWKYEIRVEQTEGALDYEVQTGPPGLIVDGRGKVFWAVPADFAGSEVQVSILLRDSSGANTIHSFGLRRR